MPAWSRRGALACLLASASTAPSPLVGDAPQSRIPCWEEGHSREECCAEHPRRDCFDSIFTRGECCHGDGLAWLYPAAEVQRPAWRAAFDWAAGGPPAAHPSTGRAQRRWEASMANASVDLSVTALGHDVRLKAFKRSGPDLHATLEELQADAYRLRHLELPQGRRVYVVDIGANIGAIAVLLAKLLGPAVRLVAVEPAPGNFRYLVWNIRLNGLTSRIWPLNFAMGAPAPAARFFYSPTKPTWSLTASNLHCPAGSRVLACASYADLEVRFDVEVVSLPELLAALGLGELHFLKVDCEGCEWDILAPLTWSRLGHRVAHVAAELHGATLPGARPLEEARLRAFVESVVCRRGEKVSATQLCTTM